jgi:hypothetical protein
LTQHSWTCFDLRTMRALYNAYFPDGDAMHCNHRTVRLLEVGILWCSSCGAIAMPDGTAPKVVNTYPDFPAGVKVRSKDAGTIDAEANDVAPPAKRLVEK